MTPEEVYFKCHKQGTRNPKLELIIRQDPKWSYYYTLDVIKGRWVEAEPIILQDPKWSYYYALDVIKGRWVEGEPIILQDPEWSYCYACDVIKGRWPEAEEVILGSEWESNYCDRFQIESCDLTPKPDYTL